MSELNAGRDDGDRPKGAGWKQLRRTYGARFRPDFTPIRRALRRNELVAATVELFFSALVGAGKTALREDGEPPKPADSTDPTSDA